MRPGFTEAVEGVLKSMGDISPPPDGYDVLEPEVAAKLIARKMAEMFGMTTDEVEGIHDLAQMFVQRDALSIIGGHHSPTAVMLASAMRLFFIGHAVGSIRS